MSSVTGSQAWTARPLTPKHMRNDTFVTTGCAVRRGRAIQEKSTVTNKQPGIPLDSNHRGDLLIRDLWEKGKNCVLNMRVVNTDTNSYQLHLPETCQEIVEQETKLNYIDS